MTLNTSGRSPVWLRDTAALGLAAGMALAGCASASSASDLAQVRALSHAQVLAHGPAAGEEPAAEAQAPRGVLDATGAVRIALLNHRELRAQLSELGIARGRLMQAGLVANPVVEVEALPGAPHTAH